MHDSTPYQKRSVKVIVSRLIIQEIVDNLYKDFNLGRKEM